MTHRYLLDASAILAFMSNEVGADKVRAVIQAGQAKVTAVNISEVAAKLVSRGLPSMDAKFQCQSMGLDIIDVDEEIAFAASALIHFTQPLGLSLGDRICLAAATQNACIAMTADKAWGNVPGVNVEVIR